MTDDTVRARVIDALTTGDLEVVGQVRSASNLTLVCRIVDPDVPGSPDRGVPDGAGTGLLCVYKPVRGEAPLWDFPDGTLAGREVATYLVSEALGWDVVPETVLREAGPGGADLGPGMVQRWILAPEPTDDVEAGPHLDGPGDPIELVPADRVPAGYRTVLRGYDEAGDPVVLAHATCRPLHRMAVFDALVNNADRKGGHILTGRPAAEDAGSAAHVYGIDHGICLHAEDKLRTVLWGWAGEDVPADLASDLLALADRLDDPADPLTARLGSLITADEVTALADRARRLGDGGAMPFPPGERAVPWPPF